MDMLVRLYDLPDIDDEVQVLKERGILIRRPGAYERHLVADWVGRHFSPKWVSETKTAFARQPISCFIATREKQMIGFACCLLYTSPSPRDVEESRMPSSA